MKTWLGLFLSLLVIAYTSEAQPVVPVVPQGGNLPVCSTNPDPPTVLTARMCCIIDSGAQYCGDSGGAAVSPGSGAVIGVFSDLSDVNSDADATDDEIPIGDGTEYRGVVLPACDQGDEKLHYNTATNAFSCVSAGASLLTPGADGDSSTTNSPSGLESINDATTLLRGCQDRGVLEWDETLDRWECKDRYTYDDADSPATPFHIGDGTDGWFAYLDTPGCVLECREGGNPSDTIWRISSGNTMVWELDGVAGLTLDDAGNVALGADMEEVEHAEILAGAFEEDGTHCTFQILDAINGANKQTQRCAKNAAASFTIEFGAPPAWDEEQIRIKLTMVQTNGTPDGNYGWDVTHECIGHGEAYPGTQGGSTNFDFAVNGVSQNQLIIATSGDLSTITCDEGDRVRVTFTMDTTATTATAPENIPILSAIVLINHNAWSN